MYEVVAAAVLGRIRGVEPERKPDANAFVVDVEVRRHDADDRSLDAVDVICVADDRASPPNALSHSSFETHDDERPVRHRLGSVNVRPCNAAARRVS